MVGVLVRSSFFSGIPAGSRDVLMTTRQPDFLSFETWLVLFPLDGAVSVGTAFSDGPYSHILLVSWQSCFIQVLHVGLGAVVVGLCLNSCCRFLSLPSVALAFAVPLWAFIPVSLFPYRVRLGPLEIVLL